MNFNIPSIPDNIKPRAFADLILNKLLRLLFRTTYSATGLGTQGEFYIQNDSGTYYFCVCVKKNTWKRVALS